MDTSSGSMVRLSAAYEDLSGRYRMSNEAKSYAKQYSHIYAARLFMLKSDLMERAKKRWPGARVVDRIVSASAATDDSRESDLIALVGTTFKEQARPNVLDEYRSEILHSEEDQEEEVTVPLYEAGVDDAIALEDESGRVKLCGAKVPVARLVTGVTLAALGRLTPKGDLEVLELMGPGFLVPKAPPPQQQTTTKRILLVSGLLGGGGAANGNNGSLMASQTQKSDAKFALLCDWLSGSVGGAAQCDIACSVVRCVVAGDVGGDLADAFATSTQAKSNKSFLKASSNVHNAQETPILKDAFAVRDADVAVARLCALVPVDLVPGESDPTNASLPQQPIHPLLTPNASRFSSFVAATNPHECKIGGHLVVGHSGQPVLDVLKHADYTRTASDKRTFLDDTDFETIDRKGDGPNDHFLAALEDTLYYRHLAPTAPDSLPAYPHQETDPFVIEETPPRILFAGGAPHFATSLATTHSKALTRIVALPSFSTSGIAVLVDIDTLQVQQLSFKTPAAS